MSKKIDHVAFIMDGNNRWSKKNRITKYKSYHKGAKKLIEITTFIFERYDINYVSAFALSKHNFKRGSVLINVIKNVLIDFLDPTNDITNFKFRIKFKGNLSFLSRSIIKKLKDIEKNNIKYKKQLVIYLNYSGKDDILNSIKSSNSIKNITKKQLHSNLSSAGIPDPDILIRTGGFKRISDFMLYQLSFTELFFKKKLWPDINKSDIKNIINEFHRIDRKFGN